ncbi:MAG: hypothetical protein WAN35_04735 [Terracidiphilus sp.]|jgi:hypothetical protein
MKNMGMFQVQEMEAAGGFAGHMASVHVGIEVSIAGNLGTVTALRSTALPEIASQSGKPI